MAQVIGSTAVGKMIGVHATTIRFWASRGWLPCWKTAGGHYRFDRDEIERWKKDHPDQHSLPTVEADVDFQDPGTNPGTIIDPSMTLAMGGRR